MTDNSKQREEIFDSRGNFIQSVRQRNAYTIVSDVAYLIGVPKRIFENENEPPQLEYYDKLEKNKNARLIRNLCLVRTAIVHSFPQIFNRMRYEYKGLLNMPDLIPTDAIIQLSEDGIDILRKHTRLFEYTIDINQHISSRINNCRDIFPLWISWEYIRNLFLMPEGFTEKGVKEASFVYNSNRNYYPYQVYMNWKPSDQGNVLFHDRKFVTLLYEWNGDKFEDMSKVSDAGAFTKGSIYEFLEKSEKAVAVVDCENSDPYKLYATLKNLDPEALRKISKIVLYDDIHTASAWKILEDYLKLPVEHMMIDRIKANKSLVDIRLTAGACREFYQSQADSIIIVSSDSDYWGLITSIPEARFLVMVEREKCGSDIKDALVRSGIFYCYLDDFYSGNGNDIKIGALLREMYRYIDQVVQLNVNEMMEAAFQSTRIFMSEAEKKQFYNRYIKSMHLEIGENGDVSVKLKER